MSWFFSPSPIESPFDFNLEPEKVMRLQPGEKAAEKQPEGTRSRVILVVTPGLSERGDEDGSLTSFEQEKWVVPMEVTCVIPRRQTTFKEVNAHLAPPGVQPNGDTSEATRDSSPAR